MKKRKVFNTSKNSSLSVEAVTAMGLCLAYTSTRNYRQFIVILPFLIMEFEVKKVKRPVLA